jgi:hypothetical protein
LKRRVEFRLSMPSVNSWNGRWSGEDRDYLIVREIPESRIQELGVPSSWSYSFGDGWVARVAARLMEPGEKAKKSDGFCGYDWMVDNIVRWGTAKCQCEWRPDRTRRHDDETWERCIHCGTGRQVVTA